MAGKVYNISTFRPEQCGIASWTEDKVNYCHEIDPSWTNRVIAVNGFRQKNEYADFVDCCIERDNPEDYKTAARFLNNNPQAKVVGIQHEFGIFGGLKVDNKPVGDFILHFINELEKPIVTTCHTAYSQPFEGEEEIFRQRKLVLEEILEKSKQVIAISNTAKNILIEEYHVNPDKLNVILHGIHEFSESPENSKQIVGLQNKYVMSMVGLVRRKRGMEHVIQSLPSVVKKYPSFIFLIAGKTHPKEIEQDGTEPYREFLKEQVSNLGLENNVIFIDRFLPLNSLLRYIQASDICITPYTDSRQVSSGVLSYSVGLGKPVISTPFAYAKEVLGDGRGIILPDFNNPVSMSEAIFYLIDNPDKMKEIKKNIKPLIEEMKWENVARKYIEIEKKSLL